MQHTTYINALQIINNFLLTNLGDKKGYSRLSLRLITKRGLTFM